MAQNTFKRGPCQRADTTRSPRKLSPTSMCSYITLHQLSSVPITNSVVTHLALCISHFVAPTSPLSLYSPHRRRPCVAHWYWCATCPTCCSSGVVNHSAHAAFVLSAVQTVSDIAYYGLSLNPCLQAGKKQIKTAQALGLCMFGSRLTASLQKSKPYVRTDTRTRYYSILIISASLKISQDSTYNR